MKPLPISSSLQLTDRAPARILAARGPISSSLRSALPPFAALLVLSGTASADVTGDELIKLLASTASTHSFFGTSIEIEDGVVLVGAHAHDTPVVEGGSVFFYDVETGVELFQVLPADTEIGDHFGIAVAMRDGLAVIGALRDDDPVVGNDAGSAYVFDVATGTELRKLVPSNASHSSFFGGSVALDGGLAVIGAASADPAGSNSGSAYVFDAMTGAELFELAPADAAAGDRFGQSVAILGDTILVSAINDSDNGHESGSVYVFDATTGAQLDKWTSSDGAADDRFGNSIEMDGGLAVIGAANHNFDTGAAYVFEVATGTELFKLEGSDASAGDRFGGSVDIHGDRIAVSSAFEDGAKGAAYVFDATTGVELVRVEASDGAAGHEFGTRVAVRDGVLVSSARAQFNFTGAAYLFDVACHPTPEEVILVDLDGDGDLDAATADSGTDTMTWHRNEGAGAFTFVESVDLVDGDSPVALAAGELVAGGGADIALAARDADRIRILSNDPVGTPAPFTTIDLTGVGSRPTGLSAGDLNGGGADDLLIALEGDEQTGAMSGVAVRLDGGAPTLLPVPPTGFGAVVGCALADLDGDGDTDAIATVRSSQVAPLTDGVLLYENDGAGNFVLGANVKLPASPGRVVAHDLDGDGDADLTIATQDAVLVLLNTGLTAGAWSPVPFSLGGTHSGGDGPFDLAAADLDDDSIPGFLSRQDVVVTNRTSGDLTRHTAYVDGTTGFVSSTTLVAGAAPTSLAIGELNGDKTLDLVVADESGELVVLLTDPQSLAQDFGAGCAGTGGVVPTLDPVGLPVAGSSGSFGIRVANTLPFAPVFLVPSFTLATSNLGPCEIYVPMSGPQLGPYGTDASGEVELLFDVPPASSSLFGCEVYLQGAVVDPGGSFAGVAAFTNGLRLKIAN